MLLNDYSLLGKDIKVFLRNDVYGNPKNEPKLKGNSVYSVLRLDYRSPLLLLLAWFRLGLSDPL